MPSIRGRRLFLCLASILLATGRMVFADAPPPPWTDLANELLGNPQIATKAKALKDRDMYINDITQKPSGNGITEYTMHYLKTSLSTKPVVLLKAALIASCKGAPGSLKVLSVKMVGPTKPLQSEDVESITEIDPEVVFEGTNVTPGYLQLANKLRQNPATNAKVLAMFKKGMYIYNVTSNGGGSYTIHFKNDQGRKATVVAHK